MHLIGLYPQKQLIEIESDQVPDAVIRSRFGLGESAYIRVPFVDTPEPEPVQGKVWMPDFAWTEQAVTRTWVQHDAMPPSPAEVMTAARSAMADILDALPLADRMKLQPLRVQVEAALNLGQVELAHYIVTNATVETHLLPVRAQILALFPQS